MSGEKKFMGDAEPVELSPLEQAAADYCNNTRTVMPDIENMSDDSVVHNLRFMAFSAGADFGAQLERKHITKMLIRELTEMADCLVTSGAIADARSLRNAVFFIEQRLGDPNENES